MENAQTFRIEVWPRQTGQDTAGSRWVQMAHQLGITPLTGCHVTRLFFVRGGLTSEEIRRLSAELLADPVTENCTISTDQAVTPSPIQADHTIEVVLLPGVTDPVADNLVRAAHLLGLAAVERAATGQRYLLQGALDTHALQALAVKAFSNPVIQRFEIDQPIAPPFVPYHRADDTVEEVDLCDADDQTLLAISTQRCLALNLAEMKAVQTYFRREERAPSDAELEMLAQTWSEHCGHKTFKAVVRYTGPLPGQPNGKPIDQTIDGLLKTYIRGATERLMKPWIHSAFVDNAGIVRFDDRWDVAFKLETHNHPSAIEPFGGANTGVGGVVRDILGVSARPIANTDILCFGPQDLPESELPGGMLHPRRVASGVIHGIEDYGNKMGIPTVNGAILYHPGYTANPLVFCGCLGVLPHGSHPTQPQAGDLIIVLGGRTGRDGLHGATFSSMEMDRTTGETLGSAVQIGHPIQEKQVQEVVLRARDEKLYHAITDCGAGGLSSAVGEMGSSTGACVQLETVPLKYPGLRPWEIWLSEAQERMVMAVPLENWPRLQAICAGQDVEAVRIGELEATGRLRLFYGDRPVADLSIDFLHNGIPRRELKAVWEPAPAVPDIMTAEPAALAPVLLSLLAHPDIRSKESVVRRYDHEVQGGTTVKPLVGVADHGPGDATVLTPLDSVEAAASWPRAVALAAGICPAYGELDPYAMAWAAIDEAMRNVVAVGADPDQVVLLDNFCWGNPDQPDRMGSLVRCVQGCYDAAVAYGTPFVSGKDSLNNEYADQDGQRHTIPGTLLISALGIVPSVRQTTTMDLKQAGNLLYLVGDTRNELGGSHYALIQGARGGVCPQPVPGALQRMRVLHRAIQHGLIQACHDCSEGGIGVAVAEMCLAGRRGAELDLSVVPGAAAMVRDDALLFSESICRFVVEVRPADRETFEKLITGIPHAVIGHVLDENDLHIRGRRVTDRIPVADLENAWRGQPAAVLPATIPPLPPAARPRPVRTLPKRIGLPQVIILHANGSNRDHDAALACEVAGGQAEIVHINQITQGEKHLLDYHMLVIPGGFSYGDDLGAGTLWALNLQYRLGDEMRRFVESGRPVFGICNGFQVLVKAGLLPGPEFVSTSERPVTLAPNESDQFECRWVYLKPNPASPSLFTAGLNELIYCPVAHGEGRLAARDETVLNAVWNAGLAALTYVQADGSPTSYPGNPNGSAWGIAGLCNPAGNVLGMMPHPENHIFPWQHPRWHRGESGFIGLRLFENGLRSA